MATLTNEQWGHLQRILGAHAPVIALGPGCHRIGFDDSAGWSVVAARVARVHRRLGETVGEDRVASVRRFLEGFWASKLSEEVRDADAEDRLESHVAAIRSAVDERRDSTLDRCRTALATALVATLFESTRCLGNEIAAGGAPVVDWQAVRFSRPAGETEPAPDAAGPAADARDARICHDQARTDMATVVAVVRFLDIVTRNGVEVSAQGVRALPDGLQVIAAQHHLGDVADLTKSEVDIARKLLKVGAVRLAVEHLDRTCFDGPAPALTGAVIEWMADLLWHLLATDSRVPPSQAEIAFYVNLQEGGAIQGRAFSRSRPGEARRPLDPETVHSRIAGLLRTYDNGHGRWSDITPRRRSFVRTVAAGLLAAWEQRSPEEDHEDRPEFPVVALITDYDLSFERTLLELMDEDDVLHVVVPVWKTVGSSPAVIEWLMGTWRRDATPLGRKLPDLGGWEWYGDREPFHSADRPAEGPIVVKLNGSPLFDIPKTGSLKGLVLRRGESIAPATIFTERDALHAIISFSEEGGKRTSIATDVSERLNWETHSWVLLGDSFPDWLPRVRLLYQAKDLIGRNERSSDSVIPGGRARHVALDRQFDWPEQALLDALGVERYSADLGTLGQLLKEETEEAESPEVKPFLALTRSVLGRDD